MAGVKEKSGGARTGAGRPRVGRKRLELSEDTARLLFIVASSANTTPEQWIANAVAQAWQELDEDYQQRAGQDEGDHIVTSPR